MTKKGKLSAAREALFHVNYYAIVPQPLEHHPQVVQVFFSSPAGNKDVINIQKCVWKSMKDAIHQSLKGLASITSGSPIEETRQRVTASEQRFVSFAAKFKRAQCSGQVM